MPSTAAQFFHMIKRQIERPMRKPLIVMTPKSLLRKKEASSPLSDLASGGFQVIIPETEKIAAKKVKRVVLCSGKVYYDIVAERAKRAIEDVAVVRLERSILSRTSSSRRRSMPTPTPRVWCGRRKSRATRAPGTGSSTTSSPTCVPSRACRTRAALRPLPRPSAICSCTPSSRRRWSRRR